MRDNKILYNYNRIHAYMQRVGDGGGIYTLSNQTPSDIRGNYVFDLRRSPNGDPSCMIYLDKGSSEGPPKLKRAPGSDGAAGLELAFLDLIE